MPQAMHYSDLAHQVWSYAEVGYKEHLKALSCCSVSSRAAGFEVEAGVAGIPTSFVASFGSGKPVIGILGEFDALTGLVPAVRWVIVARCMKARLVMPVGTICLA